MGRIDVAKLLVERGAYIESRNNKRRTALIEGIFRTYYQFLLKLFIFLIIASREGHIKLVNLLVERDANIEEKDDDGLTALDHG
jgi:ankyrin repeat protein